MLNKSLLYWILLSNIVGSYLVIYQWISSKFTNVTPCHNVCRDVIVGVIVLEITWVRKKILIGESPGPVRVGVQRCFIYDFQYNSIARTLL